MKKTSAAVRLLSLSLIVMIGATALPAQADDKDDKRGFRPGRLIGKLIPGGKDREETSPTMAPPVSDGAVVIPNPQNPVVPPQAPTRPPVATSPAGGTGERIPPPPMPGTAGNPAPIASANPVPVPPVVNPGAPTTANPFGEPMEKDRERGLLSGVAGVVGKVIPGGRDDESVATVVAAPGMTEPAVEEDRGILGRLRDRKGNRPASGDNLIPPPTIIPRPMENPAVLPPPDRPNSPDTMADAPAQRLTIPLTRSGNPGAPVQREERDPDEVKPSQPASIDPTMPPSGAPAPAPATAPAEAQAAVGRLAASPMTPPGLSAPAIPPASASEAQAVSEPITPSVPVSRLTAVPGDARPAIVESAASSVAVSSPAGQMSATSGAPTPAETNRIPSPTLPPSATTPESAPAASPERRSVGLVISDQGGLAARRETSPQSPVVSSAPAPASPAPAARPSAVAALTGQPAAPPEPEPVAVPRPVPSSSTSTAGAPAPEPPTGSTHFVSIREGVDGSVKAADGRSVPVPVGTVMRWQGGDEKTVKVRLADGTEAVVETWQVRDATFDEAVEFLKKSG